MKPTILYESEHWVVKKQHIYKVCVAEMRMLIYGVTRKDRKKIFLFVNN